VADHEKVLRARVAALDSHELDRHPASVAD
jgi:hypothetical protein